MAVNRHPGRLDADAPLVLDTRALGRRPGSLQTVDVEVAAPGRLGVALIAVPAGGPLDLDLRLESVMDGVLVTGEVSAEAVGECSRCLDPLAEPVVVALTELYVYPDSPRPGAQRTDADEESDQETREVVDDLLDLEPAVVDALVLALPLQPLCRPDCPGLCAECGERLAVLETGHRHETMDPRWAALASKFAPVGAESPTPDPPRTAGASTDVEEK